MKNRLAAGLAAGMLAATMIITGVPQTISPVPTVTAYAAKKKLVASPKKLSITKKNKKYTIKVSGIPKNPAPGTLITTEPDIVNIQWVNGNTFSVKAAKNGTANFVVRYKSSKVTIPIDVDVPEFGVRTDKYCSRLIKYVKSHGKKEKGISGKTLSVDTGDGTTLIFTQFKDKEAEYIDISYTRYDSKKETDTVAGTSVFSTNLNPGAYASRFSTKTGKEIYNVYSADLDLNKYRVGDKLKYYKISKGKSVKANNKSVTTAADKSIGEMYKALDKYLKDNLGFGLKQLGMKKF